MSAHHELKCWPQFFDAIQSGDKNFEVRWDDRGYQAGDTVTIREFDESRVRGMLTLTNAYTGRELQARIGYVLHAIPVPPQHWPAQPGHNLAGYVVFSLLDVTAASSDTGQTKG
jgi:hypothetical protein